MPAKRPRPPQRLEPAIVSLVLFGSKAILSGQVAEEAVREQLIAAVRRAYSPPYLVISDELNVRGDCEPAGDILQTLEFLPPPPKGRSAALFAVAKHTGGTWTALPVTPTLVEAGGLQKNRPPPRRSACGSHPKISLPGAIEELRLHLAPPASR
ncbi:MAG: hypothetical protein QM767_06520 [Anaeromyxobacter sp.]